MLPPIPMRTMMMSNVSCVSANFWGVNVKKSDSNVFSADSGGNSGNGKECLGDWSVDVMLSARRGEEALSLRTKSQG